MSFWQCGHACGCPREVCDLVETYEPIRYSPIRDPEDYDDEKQMSKSGPIGEQTILVTNRCNVDEVYRKEGKIIGYGAYGSVQKALHRASGVCRAIKCIPKQSMPDPTKVSQEIEIMKVLDHPNIVKLHETFEDAGHIYLVMELCSGGELFDWMKSAKYGVSEKAASKVVKQIASAVAYMHMASIVHGDIKPENIMFLNQKDISESCVKVVDFGESKRFVKGTLIISSRLTPHYVAPEVIIGKHTELCDVWSLGVVIYILLCGMLPFFGDCDADIFQSVKTGVYDFKDQAWDTVSKDAKHLISKMLVVDPGKRFTSEQVLHHPWLEKFARSASEASLATNASKVFRFRSITETLGLEDNPMTFGSEKMSGA